MVGGPRWVSQWATLAASHIRTDPEGSGGESHVMVTDNRGTGNTPIVRFLWSSCLFKEMNPPTVNVGEIVAHRAEFSFAVQCSYLLRLFLCKYLENNSKT